MNPVPAVSAKFCEELRRKLSPALPGGQPHGDAFFYKSSESFNILIYGRRNRKVHGFSFQPV
jgi:hypothetical protein